MIVKMIILRLLGTGAAAGAGGEAPGAGPLANGLAGTNTNLVIVAAAFLLHNT